MLGDGEPRRRRDMPGHRVPPCTRDALITQAEARAALRDQNVKAIFVAESQSTQNQEMSRMEKAKIIAKITLEVIRELPNEIVNNPLPYASAATVAGAYTWIDNGNPLAIALGIGFGVITSKLVEEWQKGPYHA